MAEPQAGGRFAATGGDLKAGIYMALLIAWTEDAESPPGRSTPLHWYISFVHITQATAERRRNASERQFAGTSALAAEPLHVETLSNPWKKAGITAPLWAPHQTSVGLAKMGALVAGLEYPPRIYDEDTQSIAKAEEDALCRKMVCSCGQDTSGSSLFRRGVGTVVKTYNVNGRAAGRRAFRGNGRRSQGWNIYGIACRWDCRRREAARPKNALALVHLVRAHHTRTVERRRNESERQFACTSAGALAPKPPRVAHENSWKKAGKTAT
jgi:hypothetical protein